MEYRITDLEKTVVQRDGEIVVLRKRVADLEVELEKYKVVQNKQNN